MWDPTRESHVGRAKGPQQEQQGLRQFRSLDPVLENSTRNNPLKSLRIISRARALELITWGMEVHDSQLVVLAIMS